MPASINNPVHVLVTIDADATSGTGTPVVATVPRACTLVQLIATTSVGEALDVDCDHNGSTIVIFGTGASGGDTAAAPNLSPAEVDFAAGDTLTVTTSSDSARGTVLAVFYPTPAQQVSPSV